MRKIMQKIRKFFSKKENPEKYNKEKAVALSSDIKAKVSLAGDSQTHKEILLYLAEHDTDPGVRKMLAKNMSTPMQASPMLAGDSNEEVRFALAERLVRLLPELNHERHSQLYAYAVQALGTLALDEVLKIRKALSSALQDYADAPPKVAEQLARDIEREVSEPILKFCAAISDEVLIDILKGHPATWAVQAIAGRKKVSKKISQAVIDTKDRPGGAVLINNKGAEISEGTLAEIIERARDYPEWQTHLAARANLPPKMAKTLAKFADRSVQKLLAERADFDTKLVEEIAEIFSRRLDFAKEGEQESVTPLQRVRQMAKEDRLNEETLADALGMRDRDFICAALAHMAGTDLKTVEKVFSLKAARPIVALAWKAKLPMRFALRLQMEVGHVQPKDLIYPRDGTDYPLTRDEMLWQLEFVGVKAA